MRQIKEGECLILEFFDRMDKQVAARVNNSLHLLNLIHQAICQAIQTIWIIVKPAVKDEPRQEHVEK
ncbi:hypothetical protein [Ruegeria profundi]|uniref:hypothetical protein n=1 Tax=Ruegeria profundi TaxID=1685378 RepID=UPI001F33ABBC|nr:hypothetical protein [Ruegeria profundi]